MINQDNLLIMINGEMMSYGGLIEYQNQPVYEVIRLIDGVPLFFKEHMERFYHSLALVDLMTEATPTDLLAQIKRLSEAAKIQNQNIRMEFGIGRRTEEAANDTTKDAPILVIYFVNSNYPDKDFYSKGVQVELANIVRYNPHAKVVNKEYVSKVAELRQKTGAYEIILMDESGKIAEGSRSNLFFIKGQTVYSAKAKDILMGITRLELMGIFNDLNLDYIEKDIVQSELNQFDACFLSGTSIGVLPIKSMNEMKYNSSENHVILKLIKAYTLVMEKNIEQTRRLL